MKNWSEGKKECYQDFIEQMIKDGYIKKNTRELFIKPTIEELEIYFDSKTEAKKFYSFYESKGWKVGKTKMVSWKSAASGWKLRNKEAQNEKTKRNETESINWDSTDWGYDIAK